MPRDVHRRRALQDLDLDPTGLEHLFETGEKRIRRSFNFNAIRTMSLSPGAARRSRRRRPRRLACNPDAAATAMP